MREASRRQVAAGTVLLWVMLVVGALLLPNPFSSEYPSESATRNTARVAVFFWALSAAFLILRRRSIGKILWTVACGAYLLHVATAFDRVHGWSHDAAFTHVENVSGFGSGIFVSYFFTLLWLADVLWWWLWPTVYEIRAGWLDRLIHGFMAFIVFNGTVVYETGLIRWAGIFAFCILGTILAFRFFGSRGHVSTSKVVG